MQQIDSNISVEHGHLRNTLDQLCNTNLTDVSQAVDRSSDIALSTIFTGVSAILISFYLKARLSGQLAAFYRNQIGATARGTEQEKNDDASCQAYLNEYRRAVIDLHSFIHGNVEDDAPHLNFDEVINAILRGPRSIVETEFGPRHKIDISEYAARFGWGAAMNKFLMHRRAARLLLVGDVTHYDNHHSECHPQGGPMGGGGCHSSGSDGFEFYDSYDNYHCSYDTDRWSSGCCHQNDHSRDHQQEIVELRAARIAHIVDGMYASYAQDFDTIKDWQDKTDELLNKLPPAAPDVLTASGKWGGVAPANSKWAVAKLVDYAVSVYAKSNPDVPSPRSDFFAPVEINGRCKPLIQGLPALSCNLIKVQVWRRFYYQTSIDPATEAGLPEIVYEITDPNVISWVDEDPAILPSKRGASFAAAMTRDNQAGLGGSSARRQH